MVIVEVAGVKEDGKIPIWLFVLTRPYSNGRAWDGIGRPDFVRAWEISLLLRP